MSRYLSICLMLSLIILQDAMPLRKWYNLLNRKTGHLQAALLQPPQSVTCCYQPLQITEVTPSFCGMLITRILVWSLMLYRYTKMHFNRLLRSLMILKFTVERPSLIIRLTTIQLGLTTVNFNITRERNSLLKCIFVYFIDIGPLLLISPRISAKKVKSEKQKQWNATVTVINTIKL